MENVTLLTTSVIGSPSASSTAIKPMSCRRLTGSENTRDSLSSAGKGVLLSPMESPVSETQCSTRGSAITNMASSGVGFMLHLTESQVVDSIYSTNQHDHTSSATDNSNIDSHSKTESQSTAVNESNPHTESSDTCTINQQDRHDNNDGDITKDAKQWVDTSDPFQSSTSFSMIEDETEPTIIREAAEFSLFNRENLQTESLDNISLLSTKNEDANKEGVTNTPNISNVMTPTSKMGVVNSSSIPGNTSSIVGGLSAYLIPSTPLADSLISEAENVYQALDDTTGQLHDNPFDSSDEFSQDFEELDIGVRDTEALLNELKHDEILLHQQSIQSGSSSLTSPICFDTTFSAVPSTNDSHTKPPTEVDMSMTTYFESKSYPLGPSFSGDNLTTERPTFGSSGHILISPPGVCPSSCSSTPTINHSPDDTHSSISIPVTSLATIATSKASSSSSVTLSPLITPLSPDTAALPQLDLANILTNMSSMSDIRTSTSRAATSSHVTPLLSTLSPVTPINATGGISSHLPLTPSPHNNDLPSLYFQESSTVNNSTLMVSELSVLPITPAPSKLRLLNTTSNLTTNAYTPSIADTTKFCNLTEIDDVTLQDKSDQSFTDQINNESNFDINELASNELQNVANGEDSHLTDVDVSIPMVPGLGDGSRSLQVMDGKGHDGTSHSSPCISNGSSTPNTNIVSPSNDPHEPSLPSDTDSKGVSLTFSVLDESTQLSCQSSHSNMSIKSQASDPSKLATPSNIPQSLESIASTSSFDNIITKSASKTAQIKALLDSTTLNAQTFLASLTNRDALSSSSTQSIPSDKKDPPSPPFLPPPDHSEITESNDPQSSLLVATNSNEHLHYTMNERDSSPHPHSDSPRPFSSSRSTSPSILSSNCSSDNERLQQTPSIDSKPIPSLIDHDSSLTDTAGLLVSDSSSSSISSHFTPAIPLVQSNECVTVPALLPSTCTASLSFYNSNTTVSSSLPSLLLPAANTSLIISRPSDITTTSDSGYHHTNTTRGEVPPLDIPMTSPRPHPIPTCISSVTPTHTYASNDNATFDPSLSPAVTVSPIINTSSSISATACILSSKPANQISISSDHISSPLPMSIQVNPRSHASNYSRTPYPKLSMSNDCTFCTPLISSSFPKNNTSFYNLPMSDSPVSTPFGLPTPPITHKPIQEIDLPETVTFESVCCIYTRQQTQLAIKNMTEKWLQYRLEIDDIQINDDKINTDAKVFDCPNSKCFIGPWKEEIVKISFIPTEAGSHTAVLHLIPYSKSTASVVATPSSISRVQLQALAEKPQIHISTDKGNDSNLIDYGVVLAGKTSSKPLYLVNHGQASVPLTLALSLDTPSWSYFSLVPNISDVPNHDEPDTSVRIVLPGKPANQDNPVIYSFLVHFNPPIKPSSSQESLSISSYPDEYSSKIDLFIESVIETSDKCIFIADLYLKAVVGVVRLHAPRALQNVSFSCPVGSTVTQSCPLKNAGNIPIIVQVECDQPDWFIIKPDTVIIQPHEESFVQILFNPLQPIKTIESNLFLTVNPDGPTYQIKLRGVVIEQRLPEFVDKGILECNQPSMFWTGVDIGEQSSCQDLVIKSTYSITSVALEVQIRDPEIFKFQSSSNKLCNGLKISLDPKSMYKFQVVYVPSSITLQHSFVDILDTVHDRRYKVPLFGYGGQSSIKISNCMNTDQGMIANIGEVTPGKQCIKSLKLTNIGERPSFVRALGFPADNSRGDSMYIIPDKVMIHPKQTKVLQVVYTIQKNIVLSLLRRDNQDHPLAKLVFYTGDEIVRRLVMSLSQYREGESELVDSLRGYFIEQDTVPSDFEHVPIEGIVTTNLLESHTTTHNVTLTGSIGPTPAPIPFPPISPPRSRHLSNQIKLQSPSLTRVPVPKPSTDKILQVQSVIFVDTVVKEFEESSLMISNPYPVKMEWRLLSQSPAFVKEVDSSSGSLFKSKYSPFWVHQCSGEIEPHSQTIVSVSFQPQDVGLYSQIWDLQVVTSPSIADDSGTRKLKLSFGGRAISHHHNVTRQKLFPTKPIVQSEPDSSAKSQPPLVSKSDSSNNLHPQAAKRPKRLVYLKSDRVEFPVTEVGKVVVEKLVVYNKDTCEHKFQVIKPHPPFSVVHYEFTLKQRESARLPIYFTPTEPSKSFESIVGIRTYSGDQMFSILRGQSV